MPHDPQPETGHSAGSLNPVLVTVTRGSMVESGHRGAAVIADRNGKVVAHWGNFERPVYPRSAIKPVQAIPLIESGAAEALAVTDAEIALACSSHNAEPDHVERVRAWLARIGCPETALACGARPPMGAEAAAGLIRDGIEPGPVHNPCSGKHAGFLSTAHYKGEPLDGYTQLTHPVQQRLLGVIEQMTGQDLGTAPWARDGCAIPTFGISLGGLAVAMARFADPADLPERRIAAVLRIRRAWGGHPHLVAGSGRFDTKAMQAAAGRALVKTGAEGVFCACLPGEGLGIALKIDDGATRASEAAMAALLRETGVLDDEELTAAGLGPVTPITTWSRLPAGEIRPADGFPN
ncbi:MAG: asparaginase [Alphaproteobacteria bacterium]|jgi:L-asparaginase II|nr:asparaginase [Alphaproteobacteria bacterium]